MGNFKFLKKYTFCYFKNWYIVSMTDENGVLTNNAIGINIKNAIFRSEILVDKFWQIMMDKNNKETQATS